jgi:hypothetical protein
VKRETKEEDTEKEEKKKREEEAKHRRIRKRSISVGTEKSTKKLRLTCHREEI